MQRVRQLGIVFVVLCFAGNIMRFPEQNLTEQLTYEGILDDSIAEENLQLGQTGAAVVLGGLRSLLASIMNLQAFGAYEKQDWGEVKNLYGIITTLQPKTEYYWETAGWHFIQNAYSDYDDKPGVSIPRRRQKQREVLRIGEQFLLQGVSSNPESVPLWQQLGRIYSDPFKPYNFVKASSYFESASQSPNATLQTRREYFYALARVPDQVDEAWKLGSELFDEPLNRRFPSMRSLVYTLNLLKKPELANGDALLDLIFTSKEEAYVDLVNYWQRTEREQFPRANLKEVITRLAWELDVPAVSNPFENSKLTRLRGL